MFEHSTEATNTHKCGRKASAIVAFFVAPSSLDESSQTAPSSARGMRNDRVRSRVESRIAILVPRIHVRESEVSPVFRNEESGDQFHSTSDTLGQTHEVDELALACPELGPDHAHAKH